VRSASKRTRQHRRCDQPFVRVEDAEAAVVRHYATLRLPKELGRRLPEVLDAALTDEEQSAHHLHAQLKKLLRELEAREENLLDLAEGGGIVASKVRQRIAAIAEQTEHVEEQLRIHGPQFEAGGALIRAALDLMEDPQGLYDRTTDRVRRQTNQIFFGKLYLDAAVVVDDELAEPFDELLYRRHFRDGRAAHPRSKMPSQ
jgi:site-specific DNA recombinase